MLGVDQVQLQCTILGLENAVMLHWLGKHKKIRCAACGKTLHNISLQRLTRPYLWCSRTCFMAKSGIIVKLEKEYDKDIVDILKDTARCYKNLNLQARALGVTVPYLYELVKKYCGDYLEFMAKNSTGQQKKVFTAKLNRKKNWHVDRV